ncbi:MULTISPECIES: NAD(P)-dependent malic enzyme [Bacillaceae]|uniref:Malate dehydrogenase n=1 Tax=Alkalicoccobacillus plakortidis TaxID=444060 RepID=A0A9D5I176_9BACI|nr:MULTISPECIES: NADP-dependent malic enzyme [Bacillaceae]KQL57399.1 malate dehydrogenase [Alkalicoccobacillus plakortidis]RQW18985.1 NADP-dependent malic enzyme [Bacillus sp. C1-1]
MQTRQLKQEAIALHRKGKMELKSTVPLTTEYDMSLAYTPGVAEPCKLIAEDKSAVYDQTIKGNLVAIVTDGSAVLGLGDIGPEAALPVMEGKAVLFKEFAGVDAVPLCLDTKNVEEIIQTVKAVAPTFGGINLEDIAAPRCFEIEKRLQDELNIPVFHDDQHGTAIVVLAAVINALQYVRKDASAQIVINGAGAAGLSIASLLLEAGYSNVTLVSLEGIIQQEETWLNPRQREVAQKTNPKQLTGGLNEAINGADVFIGVSGPKALSKNHVSMMNADAVVFALANPVPEIYPEEAKAAGAAVVGTGRSDFANQINNVLAFPGIFRGALDSRAGAITTSMKLAAATAIAGLVETVEAEQILPSVFDKRIATVVAEAVANEAKEMQPSY